MGAYAIRAGWFGWAGGGFASEKSASAPAGAVVASVQYARPLRVAPQPTAAQFTATVNGVARSVASVAAAGSTVAVTLTAPNLTAGQTVVITYAPGAPGTGRLAYSDGQELPGGSVTIVSV